MDNETKKLHPEGMHLATVLDHGITKSGSGTPQVAIKFETEYGIITGWFALTHRAAEYTAEKVAACGFVGDSFADLNTDGLLVGNRCKITVRHETYEGETRAKIQFINSEDYAGYEIERDMEAAQAARAFDALIKKQPKKPRPVTPESLGPVGTKTTASPDPFTGEEAPF